MKKIIGFKASNDNGKTWFEWYYNEIWKQWSVDEPDSLSFSTEEMLSNKGRYSKCEPIYE